MKTLADLESEVPAERWRELPITWNGRRSAFFLDGESDPRESVSEPPQQPRKTSPLRPATSDGFIGQKRVLRSLLMALRAAWIRGEPLGHVLLCGPAGLGKTTLAQIVATEMGARLHTALGTTIEHQHQIVSLLTRLEQNDVLFIDEIHNLPRDCQETLYTALEDGYVEVLVTDGGLPATRRVLLAPFTLVGATTRQAKLCEPFRSRFTLRQTLRIYTIEELARISEQAAGCLEMAISPDAAQAVANRSRGVPREAIRILKVARDLAQTSGSDRIESSHVEQAGEHLDIDRNGLGPEDRKILELLLTRGRPVGAAAIAAALRLDPEELEFVHEPYLLERRFIERTPRGRVATEKAWTEYG